MPGRKRFIVVEARRLVPLLFLLVLLISLSVYDNFFRLDATGSPEVMEDTVVFSTTGRGEMSSMASFMLAYSEEEWDEIRSLNEIGLPEYPLNPMYEVAVLALNSEIESVRALPQDSAILDIEVQVSPRHNYYHLITLDRDQVSAGDVHWIFKDDEGRVLAQLTPFRTIDEGQQGEEIDAEGDDVTPEPVQQGA